MKISVAVSAALLALTAACLPAGAGQRDVGLGDTGRPVPGGIIVVQDRGFGRDFGRGYGGGDRRHGRDDRFDDVIPERRIVRQLMRAGFVSVEDIDLRRDRYIVRAVRPNGALIRLTVDAYDGEVLSRDRIGWAREGGFRGRGDGWRGGPRPGPDFDFGGGFGIYRR